MKIEVAVPASSPKSNGKEWFAGTLKYTKPGLVVLFFWLLWNDLCLMLMEQVAPQLTPLLLKEHGASSKEIAIYMTTLTSMLTIWINPVVSTWSDRHRSPWGRRRPFLFIAAPLCGLMLAAIPFGPDLANLLGLSGTSAVVLVIGILYLGYTVFNGVILALFTYYFWDVVPEEFLGRFMSLTKMVATLAGFLWSYFIFGRSDTHMKEVFVGIAIFFVLVYLLTLWRVKEGEYPPPPQRANGNIFAPVRSYFVECFGQQYYLWVFAAFAFYQISNLSNVYLIIYLRDDLGMNLDTIGKMRAWPALLTVFLAYPLGAMIDRFKPVRITPPTLLIWAGINILGLIFLRDRWSLLIYMILWTIPTFIFGVASSVLCAEIFPREKVGQYCSANTISQQIVCLIVSVPMGIFFDFLKDYRYIFLWSAAFQILAALVFFKVYTNWKRLQFRDPDIDDSTLCRT